MAKEESMRLRLTAETKARLQAEAERTGLSMTALIERALDPMLDGDAAAVRRSEVALWAVQVERAKAELAKAKDGLARAKAATRGAR